MWSKWTGIIAMGLALTQTVRAEEKPKAESPSQARLEVDFVRDVQPIFTQNCYKCHSSQKVSGGLRLDEKSFALRGGDKGVAIKPGDSAGSLLIRYVSGLEEIVMPPKGDRLTPKQIDVLASWIDQGAKWPDTVTQGTAPEPEHWAFRAVKRPDPPKAESGWARNPIDAFILSKLKESKLEPSPEADRPTLIRRLSLDLIGLPPTPAEVDDFLNDKSPYAYERVVRRLLASPHFGERWGRHWLDLARYADSDGYEKDLPRPNAWRYRDWVIDALNRDLPYDEFVVEQLAGDLMPNPTVEQLVATGFHRNTLTNLEGGVDKEQFRVEQIVDRTNTTGSVFLGLTVGCAQCHTHKYDPITHREYYQMFAFFNTSVEKDIPAPLAPEVQNYKAMKAAYDSEHAKLQKSIDAYKPQLAEKEAGWEAQLKFSPVEWKPLELASYLSAAGASFKKMQDGSLLVEGQSPAKDTYTIVVNTKLAGITGFRLEALADPSLPKGGPGRAANGNLVLSEFTVTAGAPENPLAAKAIPLTDPVADFAQESFTPASTIDGKLDNGWAVGDAHQNRAIAFTTKEDAGSTAGVTLTFKLEQQYGQEHTVGRLRLSATTAKREYVKLPFDVQAALGVFALDRSNQQKAALLEYYGKLDPKMRELAAAREGHASSEPKPPATQAQTLVQNPTPPKTHIHLRGDFLRPGDEVQPATLAVLPPLQARGAAPDRLDLARWITDPTNPLTARVEANRIWEHLFGRGIVLTSEDFGTRGEPPSHPELLDWLASEFIARGWSRKAMIDLIVNSAAYRQASVVRPELRERDPNNVLIARQGRFREEAEITRDVFLAASGLLNPTIGGPGVRPPLPAGVAELGYANQVSWPQSQGEDKYRRGLYIFFQRTVPYPMLMTFDCPDSNVSIIRRSRSNTPLQALNLLNDPVFVECAQGLGKRLISEGPADAKEKLRFAFRLCLSREPSDAELTRLQGLLADEKKIYEKDVASAAKLVGDPKIEPEKAPEAAAWIAMGRTIMNLDEFVTRE